MDASAKGTLTKSLRWALAPDGKSYFVTASAGGSAGQKASVTVALSRAEYYVLESVRRGRRRGSGAGHAQGVSRVGCFGALGRAVCFRGGRRGARFSPGV